MTAWWHKCTESHRTAHFTRVSCVVGNYTSVKMPAVLRENPVVPAAHPGWDQQKYISFKELKTSSTLHFQKAYNTKTNEKTETCSLTWSITQGKERSKQKEEGQEPCLTRGTWGRLTWGLKQFKGQHGPDGPRRKMKEWIVGIYFVSVCVCTNPWCKYTHVRGDLQVHHKLWHEWGHDHMSYNPSTRWGVERQVDPRELASQPL